MAKAQRTRFLAIAAAVACLLLLAPACSSQQLPRSGPPATQASGTAPAGQPWRPGKPQLGIDVYWSADAQDSTAVTRAKTRRIINYAISLHANSIGLSFPFYTYGITSDAVYSGRQTPSPERIAIFLGEAAEKHIRVTLRPLLDEDALFAQNPKAWRGSIQPADRAAWFQSYQKLLLPYAAVAAHYHCATFIIGTELDSLQGDHHWPELIRAIKTAYSGQLLYDENYSDFQQFARHLPLHAVGVDAYPRFRLPDNASVGRLTSAWEKWLGTHPLAVRRRTVLSEVGISSIAGAYSDPGKWRGLGHSHIIASIQENWYQAACRAFTKERLAGIYWWDVNFNADPSDPAQFAADPLTFLGRPSQREIKSCFAAAA